MYRPPRHFTRSTKKNAVEKVYSVNLKQSELESLIRLLEFSQMEILRTFKKFNESDYDLKEIYWYYRHNANQIRKKLQKLKD